MPPPPPDRRYVSPGQVARALGISESTVKRWVDEKQLAAHRTVGKHRRILVQDVMALINRRRLPHVDLTLLGAAGMPEPVDTAAVAERLFEALRTDDAEEARRLILDAHQGGMSVPALGDEVISPVMARIGHGWSDGQLDVYQEHRGTQHCLAALMALKVRVDAAEVVGPERPLALGGGPEGDHYLMANLLIAMTLRELGWRVVNVGPNTPLVSLRRAVRDLRPRLAWLSCSYLADPEAFLVDYHAFYEEVEAAGVAVSVGGRALTEALRRRMTFTHHGDRLGHLAAFARRPA